MIHIINLINFIREMYQSKFGDVNIDHVSLTDYILGKSKAIQLSTPNGLTVYLNLDRGIYDELKRNPGLNVPVI